MTPLRTLSLLALLLTAVPGMADVDEPAGLILYAETPTGIEYLLADHAPPSDRGWGSFGGHGEAGETVAETAARETEEETRGAFRREDLLAAIGDQEPLRDGPYSFFVVKVDRIPISEIEGRAIPRGDAAFAERGPFAWIPASEIARFFDPETVTFPLRISADFLPADRHTDYVWPIWLHNLTVALEANAIE